MRSGNHLGERVPFSSTAPSKLGLIPADLSETALRGERSCVLVGWRG